MHNTCGTNVPGKTPDILAVSVALGTEHLIGLDLLVAD